MRDLELVDEGQREVLTGDVRAAIGVHDEVILEVAPGEEHQVHRLTESALTGAADLKVPLTVSVATGPSWAAAKG